MRARARRIAFICVISTNVADRAGKVSIFHAAACIKTAYARVCDIDTWNLRLHVFSYRSTECITRDARRDATRRSYVQLTAANHFHDGTLLLSRSEFPKSQVTLHDPPACEPVSVMRISSERNASRCASIWPYICVSLSLSETLIISVRMYTSSNSPQIQRDTLRELVNWKGVCERARTCNKKMSQNNFEVKIKFIPLSLFNSQSTSRRERLSSNFLSRFIRVTLLVLPNASSIYSASINISEISRGFRIFIDRVKLCFTRAKNKREDEDKKASDKRHTLLDYETPFNFRFKCATRVASQPTGGKMKNWNRSENDEKHVYNERNDYEIVAPLI